ncbi:LysE family translocator [Dinoroseobacter sp. S375]|uniref:LysE family translocator n=1 Tax=Dinoroseobacter sp. S375 TaxID=3415136 RepID=UPI003C7CB686
MTLAAFASIALIHLMAAISPGLSFVVITRVAAAEGLKSALALAVAFGAGAMIWAGTALFGLALVFQVMPVLLTVLKLAGAGFLLFVAFMMWRHAPDPLPTLSSGRTRSLWSVFRFGLVTQLSNPKVPVFFGAVFIGILPADATGLEMAIVLASVFVVETGWYVIVARLFSLPAPRALYLRMKCVSDRVLSVALATVGARIALT